jgi:hypothetical protein
MEPYLQCPIFVHGMYWDKFTSLHVWLLRSWIGEEDFLGGWGVKDEEDLQGGYRVIEKIFWVVQNEIKLCF